MPTLTCPTAPETAPVVGALPDTLFVLGASAMDSTGPIASPEPALSCTPASFATIPDEMLPAVGDADATIEVTCSGAGADDCTFEVTVAPGAAVVPLSKALPSLSFALQHCVRRSLLNAQQMASRPVSLRLSSLHLMRSLCLSSAQWLETPTPLSGAP